MGMTPAERLIAAANCQEPDCVPVALVDLIPVYFRKWVRASGRKVGKDLASRLEAQLDFFQQWPEVVPWIDGPAGLGIGLRSWPDRPEHREGNTQASLHVSRTFITEKLKNAEVADPYANERLSRVLDQWRRSIDNLPAEARHKYGGLVWSFKVPTPLGSVPSSPFQR